jgi:hypothetical protein
LGSNELTRFGNVGVVPVESCRLEGRIHAERRKTPQSRLCWVLGCLRQQRDAIGALRNLGESNLQLVCKFHFHLQWMAEKGVGAKRSWWGKEFSWDEELMQARKGRREQESCREMAVAEIWLGF